MPFKGVLKPQVEFTVEVTTAGPNVGGTAVTIASIIKREKFTNVDTATVAPGAIQQILHTAAANVVRVMVMVSPPAGGSALVKVSQNASLFEDTITADTTFTYDITA